MEIIGDILTSSNGVLIAVLFVVLVVICIKYGNIKVNTDKIKLGIDSGETERAIMRNQKDWCKLSLEAFERNMPKFDSYDAIRGQLVLEKIYDEMVDWIMLNHIRTESKYIEIKQANIWNIVQKWTVNEHFKTEEFREILNKHVKNDIEMMVKIRKDYNKKED